VQSFEPCRRDSAGLVQRLPQVGSPDRARSLAFQTAIGRADIAERVHGLNTQLKEVIGRALSSGISPEWIPQVRRPAYSFGLNRPWGPVADVRIDPATRNFVAGGITAPHEA